MGITIQLICPSFGRPLSHSDGNSLSTFHGPDTIAELSLTDDLDKNIPPYAILSHT